MGIYSTIKASIDRRKELRKAQNEWRDKNSHNFTTISSKVPDVIDVGNGTYGNIDIRWFWDKREYLSIGHYCSIAEGVLFLTGGNHPLHTLSSFPFSHYYNTGESYYAPTKGPIVIGDDVWIGLNATILSGVTIGQGAVIGANSVVAKDVPPYAIFAGNRVVKYRFSEEIIDKLIKFDYSKLTPDDIIKNRDLLKEEIDLNFFETDFYKKHLKDKKG